MKLASIPTPQDARCVLAVADGLPKAAEKVDYKAEPIIVIGKTGKHIPNNDSALASMPTNRTVN